MKFIDILFCTSCLFIPLLTLLLYKVKYYETLNNFIRIFTNF